MKQEIAYKSKKIGSLDKEDVQEIRDFIQREKLQYQRIKSKIASLRPFNYVDSETQKKLENVKRVIHEFESNGVDEVLAAMNNERLEGYLTLAYEGKTIVGFGVIVQNLQKPEPHNTRLFFGRATEAAGKGIATGLLTEQIRIIRSSGVRSFVASISDTSKKVYDRLEEEGFIEVSKNNLVKIKN